MEQLRALIADAQRVFASLTDREKRLLGLAAGAVSAFLLFIVLFSFSSTAAGYRRRTADKVEKLAEVQRLASSFRDAEQARKSVEEQLSASNVRLISYLDEKGTTAGLKIPTMNPKSPVGLGDDGKIVEQSVDLTLTDISIAELVSFLSSVESGPGVVKVTYLRVEPRAENKTVTAWATISTYQLKQP